MTSKPLLLSLELAPDSQPVSGTLRSPGSPDQAFGGWTELFAALEAALHGIEPEAGDPPARVSSP